MKGFLAKLHAGDAEGAAAAAASHGGVTKPPAASAGAGGGNRAPPPPPPLKPDGVAHMPPPASKADQSRVRGRTAADGSHVRMGSTDPEMHMYANRHDKKFRQHSRGASIGMGLPDFPNDPALGSAESAGAFNFDVLNDRGSFDLRSNFDALNDRESFDLRSMELGLVDSVDGLDGIAGASADSGSGSKEPGGFSL